jgi:hypothetical protein
VTERRNLADGYVTATHFIQVQCLPHGQQRWKAHHAVHPGDAHSSCVARLGDEEVIIVYGWQEGTPMLWRTKGAKVDELVKVADLAEGPVQLDGPRARWRWRVAS